MTETLAVAGIWLYPNQTVWREIAENVQALSNKEFGILKFLMQHPNEVMSREDISAAVWDRTPTYSVLDTHICTLRRKLGEPNLIKTIRGSRHENQPSGGYKFVAELNSSALVVSE